MNEFLTKDFNSENIVFWKQEEVKCDEKRFDGKIEKKMFISGHWNLENLSSRNRMKGWNVFHIEQFQGYLVYIFITSFSVCKMITALSRVHEWFSLVEFLRCVKFYYDNFCHVRKIIRLRYDISTYLNTPSTLNKASAGWETDFFWNVSEQKGWMKTTTCQDRV